MLLVSACLLTPAEAQTTTRTMSSTVTFRDVKRLESAPQPPPALRQVTAELSGTVVGQPPNPSIEFVLTLQNNSLTGRQDSRSSAYIFSAVRYDWEKANPCAGEGPKISAKGRGAKDAVHGTKHDAPYPAPIQFRRIMRGNFTSYEKEESITIPPGTNVRIMFESEPVVMERVMEALRSETGENARLFKARATMAFVTAPPQPGVGGRLLDSDWIFFTIPSLY